MELTLSIEQLQLKSEHLHTDPRLTHYHEDNENPLFVSWCDCVTVLYPLCDLAEASLWNPVEPIILPISNPIQSVLTFDSKIYCVDKIGTVYQLKQVQRDSPDLFGCSSQASSLLLSFNYKWISLYSPQCPCVVSGATSYSEGIAITVALGEWIMVQFLQITLNGDNEIVVLNTCTKKIRPLKQFPFLVTTFKYCHWRDWFSSQRAKELFKLNVLDCQDILIIATEESKVYCVTSDMISKSASLFLNCPQKIIHIEFCDIESKKLLLISSTGIIMVMHCLENIPSSFIYLAVTEVVSVFVIDNTMILSDGVNLFIITLDKHFSKIEKQFVISLKGVLSLHRFQSRFIIAMTRLNKVYKITPNCKKITQEDEHKFKLNEKCVLENIKKLCKNIESLEEQQKKMDKYIDAVSIVARKNLVAQYCSLNVSIYSGAKAVKLGANQDEYIFAIKLSMDCSWLSFPSEIWQLLVCITNSENSSSNCGLHPFNVNVFNHNHALIVKHHLPATVAENCSSGLVYCQLVSKIQNDLINHCLVIPLNPVKLNSLYFVKAEKREKIPLMNPLEDQHKYIFKFPNNLTLTECLNVVTNKNKHRTSKSLFTNLTNTDCMPKTLYLNFFGKIVSVVFDDKIAKTIVLECIDQNALTAVRNGIISELSNGLPVNVKYAVFVDIQKQLCLLGNLSIEDKHNVNVVKEIHTKIQNQISSHLPV